MVRVLHCLIAVSFAVVPVSAENDFVRDVAPVLARRCLTCHDATTTKGDVSLESGDDLSNLGYLSAGDPEASYLLELLTTDDHSVRMPKDSEPLSADEIAAIRQWINSGAGWPDGYVLTPPVISDRNWWSLQPIETSPLPPGDAAHPIDRFIDQQLAANGLKANPRADAQTLIRRLTYDLTGSPPTRAAVNQFVTAAAVDPEQAWQAAVDELLNSPAFGEKWAQHWLDLARYAETHGYDKDKPRNNAWPYRDYVIRSFNEDKPYTRFVQEQVAGDVLFPDEPDGVLGLGFLAAGPWDFIGHWEVGEGKLDGRIAKHLDRDEMAAAVFNVFMSTTVQCAQCHNHKFDPIRTEDYYRLHAVFAAVDRADRVYAGLSSDQQRLKSKLLASIDQLKTEQKALTTRLERDVAVQAKEIDSRIAELHEKFGTEHGPEPQFGYHSQIEKTADVAKWVQLDFGQLRDIKEIRLFPAYDDYNGIGAGFGFPVRYRLEAAADPEFQTSVRLLFDATDKDQPNPSTSTIVINGDGKPIRFLRLTTTALAERKNDFIFALAEIEVRNSRGENMTSEAKVTALDSIESGVRWGTANLVDGIYYQELTDAAALVELQQLRHQRAAIERSAYSFDVQKTLARFEQQLEGLNNELKTLPEGRMVYAAATYFTGGGQFKPTSGVPRAIHLLHRGDLKSPGDRMLPGTLPLWEGAPDQFSLEDVAGLQSDGHQSWDEGQARAKLARYLTHTDNPLLWRSIANRLWQWTFGTPLVSSSNDFGRGGMMPTHPELLDYLAAKLRDDPRHSIKSVVRLLVTSNAYRRSSTIDPIMADLDASNAYQWRANRRRLTAEEFRDSLLASAGVLNRSMGGPSFQDFVIEKPQHSPHYEYHLHDPADPASHRRSIYRFVVRSQPQPLFTTLDCADPSISTPQRDESTTALQALAAWNNRLVEFAAGKLGADLIANAKSADEQITLACQLVLGRDASAFERDVLKQHLNEHGPSAVARVLFNMNAFVYLD